MKLACCYNIWDGEEFLIPSIKRMRQTAHKIVVVYSNLSNFGETNPGLKEVLDRIETDKLADEIIQFFPHKGTPHQNELSKRNLGLERCLDCDVFMTTDCDEFYDKTAFESALDKFVTGGYDSSACQMQTYYKHPDVRIVPAEDYFVPLFYKVDKRRFVLSERWPVLADPTRRMKPGKVLIFDRPNIEMHHFSMVRKNIVMKLRNSSAKMNFYTRIEEIIKWYDEWEAGSQAYFPGREIRKYVTEKIEPLFPELMFIK